MKASDLRDRLNELIERDGDLSVIVVDRSVPRSAEVAHVGVCFSSLLAREAVCITYDPRMDPM